MGTKEIKRKDGTREWRLNGRLHRVDGPAVEKPDGTKEFWVEGRRLDPRQFIFWRCTGLMPRQRRKTVKAK